MQDGSLRGQSGWLQRTTEISVRLGNGRVGVFCQTVTNPKSYFFAAYPVPL